MQTIEPFGSYEADWQPTSHTVTLKEGIDLVELQSGQGTEFEVDPSAPLPGGNREEEPQEEFDRQEVLQNLNFDCLDLGREEDSDSDEVESPFQRLAATMEDLSGDGGVLKKRLQVGIGEDVPDKALVRVHYNGYLEYADEPYDSSRLRGKQQQFVLGKEEVIPGWEVAVRSMRRNERSQFLIAPEYAFGPMGCPPRIPPNATILFEIELLGFVDYSGAEDAEQVSCDHHHQVTFEQRLAAANTEREVGNDFFQQNMIGKAIGRYLKAARQLEAVRLKDEAEEEVWRTCLKKLYLNLSLCNLKQRKSQLALSNCKRVLELDGKNVKAFFRIGQAYMQLGDFANSKKYLVRAGKLSPGNEEIRQELHKLDNAVKKFKSMEKSLYTNMFQQPSKEATVQKPEENTEATTQVPFQTRELLVTKLRALKDNPNMLELVLPSSLSHKELMCAVDVATELGLSTEKNPASGIRIFKPGVQPEDFEQYLH